jgi:hypothetical protein
MNDQVEVRAAEAILEKGVRVMLPAPFLLRMLLWRKEIPVVIRQPRWRTLLGVAGVIKKTGLKVEELDGDFAGAFDVLRKYSKPMARITAMYMIDRKWGNRLCSGLLARYLVNRLTLRKVAEICLVAMAFSGLEDFTTSIRLITGQATKMMATKNLSPDGSGS